MPGHAGRGTEFFLAFPEHPTSKPPYGDTLKLSVVVFNPAGSPVNVDVLFPKMTSLTGRSVTLNAHKSIRLALDNSLQLEV